MKTHLRLVTNDFVPEKRKEKKQHEMYPLEEKMFNKFKRHKYTPSIDHNPMLYDQIAARFGDQQPVGGVVYKGGCLFTKDTLYIDAYGRGCTSNSIGNPYREDLINRGFWNRPFPFPSDLPDMYAALIRAKNEGLKIQFGLKSEAMPWLDQKYKIGKEILHMLNTLELSFTIFTASDLVAHDDYIGLLDNATVVMRVPAGATEEQLRKDEPGAPSLSRRLKALEKLKSAGVKTKIYDKLCWEKVEETEDAS